MSLGSIALKHVKVSQIMAWNELNSSVIRVGQKLIIHAVLQNCKLSALLSFSLLSMLMACYEIEYDREPQTFGPAGELLVVASKKPEWPAEIRFGKS